jgi:hypothetical protein
MFGAPAVHLARALGDPPTTTGLLALEAELLDRGIDRPNPVAALD